jgi:hypothetical protein
MRLAALIILAGAAFGGLFMASLAVRKKLPPRWLPPLHALIAASGWALLVWSLVVHGASTLALASAIIFAVGAIVGFTLGMFHKEGRMLPLSLVFVHGAIALTALGLLIADVAGASIGVG